MNGTTEKSENVGLTLRGVLAEEGPDAITLQVGASQFEISRKYIVHMREVMDSREGKVVEAKITPDAQIIQRVIASANPLGKRPGVAGACDCACECNCACNCACSQSFASGVLQSAQGAFRNRMASFEQ